MAPTGSAMNARWLALDLEYTSYDQVKARQVIAQGWPQLGDLRAYLTIARCAGGKAQFHEQIGELCTRVYGATSHEIQRAPKALWRFFQIDAGDLVVALEGTRVRGIAQAVSSAVEGYWFDPAHHYGQCTGRGIVWVDWDHAVITETPTAPAQSVLAAAQIRKGKQQVLRGWERLHAKLGERIL